MRHLLFQMLLGNYIEKKINDNYTNNIAPVVYEKDIFDVNDR